MDQLIDALLLREGRRYTNRPNDRGGPTKFGVTQETLSDWRGRQVTAEEVRNLQEPEARDILRHVYVIRPRISAIGNPQLFELAFDCAVNHGPNNAVRMLQRAAGVTADGALGPKTEAAVNRGDQGALYRRLCAERVRFYGRIIEKDHTQAEHAAGWLNRAAEFIERSV